MLRTPCRPESVFVRGRRTIQPDYELLIAHGDGPFWYELPSRGVSLHLGGLQAVHTTRATSSITSIYDLCGAQMIVYVDRVIFFGIASLNADLTPKADPASVAAYKLLRVGSLSLSIGSQRWEFGGQGLRPFTDDAGLPYYVYTFPKHVEEFPRLDLSEFSPIPKPTGPAR